MLKRIMHNIIFLLGPAGRTVNGGAINVPEDFSEVVVKVVSSVSPESVEKCVRTISKRKLPNPTLGGGSAHVGCCVTKSSHHRYINM